MPDGNTALSNMSLPSLPLEEWEDTKETLHRYCQIVGKTRMELSPFRNHWWHVTLYVSPKGLTTGPVPYAAGIFEATFDLLENRLVVTTSEDTGFEFSIEDLPVSEFYSRFFDGLRSVGIEASINTTPFDLDDEHTLADNISHSSCVASYVQRYHGVLLWTDEVFKEFAGRFNGKQSPVQLFWHSFDLALNRFSGRRATLPEVTDPVTREAYSHEVISFGFWPGDAQVREPAFYSYTAPEPQGLTDQPLKPGEASWGQGGTAILTYEAVRNSHSPRETLLEFMQSAYLAGARTAGWDIEDLSTQPTK
jgi:hypothetical protein